MIRTHFGLDRNPFALETLALLPHQAEVLESMRCTSSVLTRRAHAPQAPAHET